MKAISSGGAEKENHPNLVQIRKCGQSFMIIRR